MRGVGINHNTEEIFTVQFTKEGLVMHHATEQVLIKESNVLSEKVCLCMKLIPDNVPVPTITLSNSMVAL